MVGPSLLLDLQATQSVAHAERGIARYVTEHALALMDRATVERLYLNPLLPFPRSLPQRLLASPALRWNTASDLHQLLWNADPGTSFVYHVMSPFELYPPRASVVPPHVLDAKLPLVVTAYDLIPLVFQDRYLAAPEALREYMVRMKLLSRADLVLAISECTRRDVVAFAGLSEGQVVSIGGGTSSRFRLPSGGRRPLAAVKSALPSVKGPYILSVAGADDRKNVEGLLAAYAELPALLRKEYQLVIGCHLPKAYEERWRATAQSYGIAGSELLLTGYVPDDLLLSLYQAASLFVFPSLYEGYGLPVAEAIACGCPAITSATSSLPEILDYPDSTFDPADPGSIARRMEMALSDPAFRARLEEVGRLRRHIHTWDRVASRTISAVEAMVKKKATHAAEHPASSAGQGSAPATAVVGNRGELRVALVSPLPPTRSGLADYSGTLLGHMPRGMALDLFVPSGSSLGRAQWVAGFSVWPVSCLGRVISPASYDALIYVIGNSEHHHETYEMALAYPGVIWFHDVRLGGLYYTYGLTHADKPTHFSRESVSPRDDLGLRKNWPGEGGLPWERRSLVRGERGGVAGMQQLVGEKLLSQYGWRLPEGVLDAFGVDTHSRYSLGLTGELVRSARGVLVNSPFAAQLLRMDQGPDALMPPLAVLPFAVPVKGRAARPDTPVIASFGIVAPVKAPELLLEAFSLLQKDRPGARLVLVGEVLGEGYQQELLALAESYGVGGSVEITGYVSDEEYSYWLEHSTCAVQWRLRTNGESSAALADAFGAGLPVVTNVSPLSTGCGEGSAVFLPEHAGPREIAHACISLIDHKERWNEASARGRDAAGAHTPQATTRALMAAISEIAAR